MGENYKGKSVLITGAGKRGRIGAQIAEHFAAEGADTIIHFRSNPEEAAEVQKLVQSRGPNTKAELVSGDLSKPEDIEKLFAAISPDIVIHNAAVFEPSRVPKDADLSTQLKGYNDALNKNFDANVRAAELVTRAAIYALKRSKKPGVVVFIGDAFIDKHGTYPENLTAYTISKAAIPALARQYAQAYGRDHIRFFAVSNGPIEPPPSAPQSTIEHMQREIALPTEELKPWLTGKRVAEAIDYGIRTSGLNGSTIPLDGGRSWTTADEHSS